MQATLKPIFGPELGTYKRLWYGTRANPFGGVTPGRFYDFRAFPVPYTPFQPTTFQFNCEGYDNAVAHVSIIRENPAPDNVTDSVDVVLTAPVTIIDIRLSKGLNTISVVVDGVELANVAVTATNVATLLHAFASNIYDGFWSKLNAIESDIFSAEPTALTMPLISFDQYFPVASNLNRIARGLVVNALMNFPGSQAAVTAMSQALLMQTPLWVRSRSGLDQAWLRGLQTQAQAVNGRTLHVWAPDRWSARYAGAVALAKQNRISTGRDFIDAVSPNDFTVMNQAVALDYEPRRSWLSMLDTEDETDLEFRAHSHTHGIVQSPGLIDSVGSVFDSGLAFDSGRNFDSYAALGDPAPNLYVGAAITPTPLFAEPMLPMSMFDKSVEVFDIVLELYGTVTGLDELEWATTTTTSTSAGGWSDTALPAGLVSATAPELASTAPGLLVRLEGTDHSHAVVLITAGTRAGIKAGTPYTTQAQFPVDHEQHQHDITISWDGGYVVEIAGNHGHYAVIEVFA